MQLRLKTVSTTNCNASERWHSVANFKYNRMKMSTIPIFKMILICLLCLYNSVSVAQQSRVDSVIVLLNKSVINKQQDTANFSAAIDLLHETSLTAKQIEQVEASAKQFEKWEKDGWPFAVQTSIFFKKTNQNSDEAISYGKYQIEKIDRLNTPEAAAMRRSFLAILRFPFRNSNRLEEGLRYFSQKLNQYTSQNDSASIADSYYVLAGFYKISGLTDLAIYNQKKSISYTDTVRYKRFWVNNISVLGFLYITKNDKIEGLKFSKMALEEGLKRNQGYSFTAENIALIKLQTSQVDSAAYYLALAKKDLADASPESVASYLQVQALYFIRIGNLEAAEKNLIECWELIRTHSIPSAPGSGIIAPDYYLAQIRIKQNKFDEAIKLLISDIERLNNNRGEILRDYKLMAELYQKTGKSELAAETYARFISIQDSLLAEQDKFRSISFEAEQQMNENELSIEKLESQNQISSLSRNFSIGIAALLLILCGSIYYRFKSKKKANKELNNTLANLKATQSQLIHAEKMASLGELTAGIAHEIQNPLNFVNNFSEVSRELLDELNEELAKGDIEEVRTLSNDLIQNLSKISHHGKRADNIVKGMLAHSRTGTGEKMLTNINQLADEYLRLSYHGLRAKDHSFNADFKVELDPDLPKIAVIPQDIGRVILNLINNAFQASADVEKPLVQLTTRRIQDGIQIAVSDNGSGIPENIKEKIFQPFFTTKPTGQGTGLGLSLSYDIVKAHGGTLSVESTEGQGTEMTVFLAAKDQ